MQTCQQPFSFGEIDQQAGVMGNLVSIPLDRPALLRSMLYLSCLGGAQLLPASLSLSKLLLRLAVSRRLWQWYPQWGPLLRFPLMLQILAVRAAGLWLWNKYLAFEMDYIVASLADWETHIVEPRLVVTDIDDDGTRDNRNI